MDVLKRFIKKNKYEIKKSLIELNLDIMFFYTRVFCVFIYILLSLFCVSYYKNVKHLTIYEIFFFLTLSTLIIKYYNNKMSKRVVYLKNIKNSLK